MWGRRGPCEEVTLSDAWPGLGCEEVTLSDAWPGLGCGPSGTASGTGIPGGRLGEAGAVSARCWRGGGPARVLLAGQGCRGHTHPPQTPAPRPGRPSGSKT